MRRLLPSALRFAVCLWTCGLPLWGQANPTIAPATLPNGLLGDNYSQTLTAAGGYGQGTYTFSYDPEVDGTLPPGLGLAANGTLSGTLTTTGTFNFTAQVMSTQAVGDVASPPLFGSQSYTVTVYADLAITLQAASPGFVGVPYTQTFTAIGGAGPSTYTWSLIKGCGGFDAVKLLAEICSPPPGLTFSATGVLSGTPTTVGTFSFIVQVSSDVPTIGAVSVSAQYVVSIAVPPLSIAGSLGGGAVGVPYSAALVATGGSPPYKWSVSNGSSIPPGLSFNTANATLSGKPTTPGVFFVTVSVSDSTGAQAIASFNITIAGPFAITTQAPLAAGAQGLAYSQGFAAAGGSLPYQWSIDTPPPGLTMNPSSGVLSGTPSASGTFNFNVTATDAASLIATQSFTVLIYPSLTVTPPVVSSGTVGVPYNQAFTASGGGGASTYTWSLTKGTPPPGLTFSAGGTIGGTPTTTGTFAFTVQVSSLIPGVGAVTAGQAFSIVIAAPLAITGSLGAGLLGVAYTAALSATGGSPPYQWSVDAPPPGLTMNPSSGVLSGTPSASGTFNFNVKLTDAASRIATQPFTVVVYPGLVITQSIMSPGTQGVPYNQGFTATGGGGPSTYAWSLIGSTPPPGLTFSAAGTLSGTPTTLGTFGFTVQVSSLIPGIGTVTASQAFSVVIAAPLAITGSLGGGTVGVAYTATLVATGGTAPYTWSVSSGAIPGGLSLGTATGTLSGIPGTAGSFSFGISVTDSAGRQATASFTIGIVAQLVITTQAPLAGGVKGVAYSQSFAATGGTPPYLWSIDTPPPGLALDPSSGALSGTPSASGTFNFNVKVADAASLAATRAFTIVITDALTIVTASLPGGTVGTAYSQQLSAAGGSPPYRWTVAGGALPAGITLDGTSGILSGVPSAPGSFTVTIGLSDTRQTVTRPFTIAIGVPPAPSITISGPPPSPAPATQPVLTVTAGSAYPIPVQGTITLTFAPNSGPDDPNVQFTTGGRTVTLQIPAGATQAQFPGNAPGVQTGTVAGTITLTLTLTAGGVNITPTPPPTLVLRVAASPPVITSATVATTSGGFNLVIVGYSTSRDMTSAAVTFTPAPGVTLAGNSVTVSLSQVFTTWYASAASAQFGSAFSLQIPFTMPTGANPLLSLSVVLSNSQGNSSAATVTF